MPPSSDVLTGTAALLKDHAALWERATRHPFLDGVREGTLDEAAFARWLVQDYHFVRRGFTFLAHMLAEAPRRDQPLLVGGVEAIEAELSWFEENAGAFGLDLDQPLLPPCRAYTDFLLALPREPYAAQVVGLWAMEQAYMDAWNTARPAEERYQEFVDHWTNPDFEDWVDALAAAADEALDGASYTEHHAARESFRWIARYERDFWQMAFES